MSISSEIARITSARDDSFTAVSAKGGTVPAGATIDDLPDAIDSIPSGTMPLIVGVMICSGSGGTWTIAGSDSNAAFVFAVDPEYFSYSQGVFICQKNAIYTMNCYVRGTYNTSGTNRACYFRIYKNGTIAYSVTSGSTYPNKGGTVRYTLELEVGDTFYVEQKVQSGDAATTFGTFIVPSFMA